MIRTKGEAGTGDIVNAVTHMRAVFGALRQLEGLATRSSTPRRRDIGAVPARSLVAEIGVLPVVTFTAGGIATPADAALCISSAPTASASGRGSSSGS